MGRSLIWSLLNLVVKDPGALSAGFVRFAKLGVLSLVALLGSQLFLQEALTPVGLMLAMSGLAALEKFIKARWGIGL
jgi:hypothetical protein